MTFKREPIKSGYLTFDQVGCTQSTGSQQEANCQNLSDPTGAQKFQIPFRSQLYHQLHQSQSILYKRLTCTPKLGESRNTRGPKRLAQTDISAVNIDEYPSMPSVNGMDQVKTSSADFHLPPEVGINQVGENDKVRNSRSLTELTKFI